jgi:hypothetical protein
MSKTEKVLATEHESLSARFIAVPAINNLLPLFRRA